MGELSDHQNRRNTRFNLWLLDEQTDDIRSDQLGNRELPDERQSGGKPVTPSSLPSKPQKAQQPPANFQRVETGRVSKSRDNGLRALRLVDANAKQIPPRLSKYKSPWKTFKRILEYNEEENRTTMVQNKDKPDKVFALREFPIQEFDRIEQRFKRLEHENILAAKGFFRLNGNCFVLSELLDLTLVQIIGCRDYATEKELASIVGQVLRGISFLVSKGMVPKELSCSTIVLDRGGHAKIVCFTGTEIWHEHLPPTAIVKPLAMIMVELMQKVPNTNGVIGVRNLERWPLQSKASKFLLRLESASSLSQLTSDEFVDPRNWDPKDLIPLVRKAMATTLPSCHLEPETLSPNP